MYLQVSQGQLTDTNARFSSMMFKVLQDSFENSQLGQEQQARTDSLAKAAYDAHLQTSWVVSGGLAFSNALAVSSCCSVNLNFLDMVRRPSKVFEPMSALHWRSITRHSIRDAITAKTASVLSDGSLEIASI